MKRTEKVYIVENEAGEPCINADGVLMHTTKKSAEREASRNRRKFQENYTVATFVREHPLPKRATGAAAARATDKLIGDITERAARAHAQVVAATTGKPPPKNGRARTYGALVRGF